LTSITRVWQALAPGLENEFPPLRTLDEARSNLPQQRTSLVGRDDDVHALAAMLEEARVITVTGVGGIGKTRLALHAAAEALPGFPGGVWLASLGNVDAADAVGDVVLAAVGGRREAERSTLAVLAELTTARRLLVILDNCEHVLGAASDCAEAVVAGGQSVVVATSREPLAVDGERVFPVPSLADDAAVTLFADRARAVDPSFNVGEHNRVAVAEICQRLDRMPLALELAAARVRSLTVQEIARRLGDRFRLLRGGARGSVERHRTLRAAIQWSYDLLDRKDQAVFARLSVFAGGFTVDAAAAVCGDDAMDDLDAIDVLDALVSRSMVIADRSRATTRYSLLETLRQFGEDKLVAAGETSARRARHAQHMLAVAETGRIQLSTPHAARAMTDFGDEWDNLRSAFEWFAAVGDVDAALRLVVACHWYAFFSYHYELLGWAERAISLAGSQDHELWTAAAGTAAMLRWATGDRAGTEALATEAVHTEEVRGSPPRLEPAGALAMFYAGSGQTQRASDALTVAERIAEREGDPVELGLTRFARVMAHWMADPAAIGDLGEDAVRDAEATGNPHQLAFAYAGLLAVAVIRRDRERAGDAFERARHWADMANNRYIMFAAPSFLAMLHEDEPREALSLVRGVVAAAIDAGFWGNFDTALRRIIIPLVHLGRCRAAALILGGLTSLPTATPDTQRVIPRAKAALADALGAELDPLLEQGRTLTRQQLARLALDEIDLCNKAV
jgi:predicted ATPase